MPRHAGKATEQRTHALDTDGIIDECMRMAHDTAEETIAVLARRHPGAALIERLRVFQQDIKQLQQQRAR